MKNVKVKIKVTLDLLSIKKTMPVSFSPGEQQLGELGSWSFVNDSTL